jgi:hypothetical protein
VSSDRTSVPQVVDVIRTDAVLTPERLAAGESYELAGGIAGHAELTRDYETRFADAIESGESIYGRDAALGVGRT